jgi:poly-beta-1,6-N-acetyl-D-glucosamine synthase
MEALVVFALALVAWTFLVYPAIVIAWSRHVSEPITRTGHLVDATVVLAVRNESSRIEQRLHNLLASEFPMDRLQVLVVDDGSTDDTADVVYRFPSERVRLLRQPEPLGKAAAINRAMAQVDTPITIFADARQSFSSEAIAALVSAFGNSAVGVAAGRLEMGEGAPSGLYWRFETALRRAESRLGCSHGASGAIYAIRTNLFQPMPERLLLDDMWIPLQIARAGYRLVLIDDAVAHDPAVTTAAPEFRRKLRTLSGNWQLLSVAPWLLLPGRNPVFGAWFSHKFLRLIAPWLLVVILLATMLAVSMDAATWLQVMFWLQVVAYGAAGLALLLPALARRIPLATAAGSFLLLNLAALMSLPAYLTCRDPARLWRG